MEFGWRRSLTPLRSLECLTLNFCETARQRERVDTTHAFGCLHPLNPPLLLHSSTAPSTFLCPNFDTLAPPPIPDSQRTAPPPRTSPLPHPPTGLLPHVFIFTDTTTMALNKVVWNLEELEEGGLRVRVWRLEDKESVEEPLVCVTTHPWGVLGGGEHNTIGVAQALAARGHIALTFTLPNSGLVWGTLSGHKAECNATVRVVDWASRRFETKRVVLIGSSAGAPVAGSCLDRHDAIVAAGFVGCESHSVASSSCLSLSCSCGSYCIHPLLPICH